MRLVVEAVAGRKGELGPYGRRDVWVGHSDMPGLRVQYAMA